jgi:hypothetical protein
VRVGEVYITTTKKEALKRVKDARKTVKKDHEDRRKEQNSLKDEMDPLKVPHYRPAVLLHLSFPLHSIPLFVGRIEEEVW